MPRGFLQLRRMDLQAKIILILVAVILPTFLIVTIVENKVTQPILADEVLQVGITSGKTLVAEILSQRMLARADAGRAIESHLQEFLYSHPNIIRVDVAVRDPATGQGQTIASSVEDEPGVAPPAVALVDAVGSELKTENGLDIWDINIPIEQWNRDHRVPKKVLGTVHLVMSMRFIKQTVSTIWRITATAAAFSVVTSILVLSFFLRKTIANDRLLRRAEDQNLQLTAQLHDAQRQLMNMEKLAVMGQLTASFAHEIGTPLNAIGGHLQLLREDLEKTAASGYCGGQGSLDRMDVIDGQVSKIEKVVKNFLQSTNKPVSQRQLVDLNRLADQTLGIVRPRSEAIGVDVKRDFDWNLGPIRVVPLDLEQILLNLVSNSLDSLKSKREAKDRGKLQLEIKTAVENLDGREWAIVSVYDTGQGIRKTDLTKVLKPFFTTKRPGEGTGLGLTICDQLARKYGGGLQIDSREGAWTRVDLRIPFTLQG